MEHPVSITAAAAAGTPPIEAAVSRGLAPFGRLCLWAAWGWMIIAPRGDGPRAADVVHASVANSPQPPSRRVSQAGGIDRSRSDVRPCGHVHPVGGHRCNGQCQGGGCPANCPVRPGSFGFYGTQWRAWPTQGAAVTTGLSDATPVSPPKSEVPKLSEESLRQSPTGAEEPARPAGDDAGAGGAAGDANVEERPRELVPPPADVRPEAARDEAGERPDAGGRRPDAVPPLEPPEEEAAPKPPNAKEPAVPAVPDAGDENRKKDDDNLFDEARRGGPPARCRHGSIRRPRPPRSAACGSPPIRTPSLVGRPRKPASPPMPPARACTGPNRGPSFRPRIPCRVGCGATW